MKRVWTTLLAAGVMLTLPQAALAVPVDDVDVYYNGARLETTQPLENWDSRLLLAFRDYFEGLGMAVDWNDSTRLAAVVYRQKTVLLEADTGRIYVDGKLQKSDVSIRMINDRMYVPLRFLSEIFDCTVEYTPASGSTRASVEITSQDAPANYVVQKEGYVQMLRRSQAPVSAAPAAGEEAAYRAWQGANSAYYIDGEQHLTEVTTYDDKLARVQIDETVPTERRTEYSAEGKYMTLGDFRRMGVNYQAVVNQPADNPRYIGVGDTPQGSYLNYVDSARGQLTLYRGREQRTLLDIAPSGEVSYLPKTVEGLLLDAGSRTVGSSDYALAADGSYGFLVDGELIIVDDRQEIASQQMVSATMKDCRIVAVGNKFVLMGIENDNSGNGDFYTAIYDTDGNVVRGYFESSNITDRAYAQITSVAQQGDTIYALVHTSWYDYLATINVGKNTAVVDQLPRYYQGIIPTAAGYTLFCADDDYYYLQALQ